MKKHLSTLVMVLALVTGFSLLLYPTVSDWWNSMHQSRAIATYTDTVSSLNDEDWEQVWADARDYNAGLLLKRNRFYMGDEERAVYEGLMNVAGNGGMGDIEIEKIGVMLPIYHGTGEAVLQVAIGHIEGSSLPTGGAGTHSVFSGHRGLPSAKLFTNLDQMAVGDKFVLHVLDERLTYEVDQILVVLPEEIEALEIDPEADLSTLVTCTPYGVNSHRMLVRGHRVENEVIKAPVRIVSDAQAVDWRIVAAALAVPMVLLVWVLSSIRIKKR